MLGLTPLSAAPLGDALGAAQFADADTSTASAVAVLTTGINCAAAPITAVISTVTVTSAIRLAADTLSSAAASISQALSTALLLITASASVASAAMAHPLATQQPIQSTAATVASAAATLTSNIDLAAASSSSAATFIFNLGNRDISALMQSAAVASSMLSTGIKFTGNSGTSGNAAADLITRQAILSISTGTAQAVVGALTTGVQVNSFGVSAGGTALSGLDTAIRCAAAVSSTAVASCAVHQAVPLASTVSSTASVVLTASLLVGPAFAATPIISAHATASLVAPVVYARITGSFDTGATRATPTTSIARAT